jgi:hypothetical protein
VHARKWKLYAATQDSPLQWPVGTGCPRKRSLRLALTVFKHIKKHMFLCVLELCKGEAKRDAIKIKQSCTYNPGEVYMSLKLIKQN